MNENIVEEFKISLKNTEECDEVEIETINQRIVLRRGRRERKIL